MAHVAPPLPTRFPCWVRATCSWGGESKKDLAFNEGDLIECLNAGDGSWWMGRLRRDKRAVGLFPSNYVEVLEESFQPVSRPSSPLPSPDDSLLKPKTSPQKPKTFRRPFQAHVELGLKASSPRAARMATVLKDDELLTKLYASCLQLFRCLVSSSVKSNQGWSEQLRGQGQRFSVWGSSFDAHEGGLDHRLSQAPKSKDMLRGLLVCLGDNLTHPGEDTPDSDFAEAILQFKIVKRQCPAQSKDSLLDRYGREISIDDVNSIDSEASDHESPTTLQGLLLDIQSQIACLYELSHVIEEPAERILAESRAFNENTTSILPTPSLDIRQAPYTAIKRENPMSGIVGKDFTLESTPKIPLPESNFARAYHAYESTVKHASRDQTYALPSIDFGEKGKGKSKDNDEARTVVPLQSPTSPSEQHLEIEKRAERSLIPDNPISAKLFIQSATMQGFTFLSEVRISHIVVEGQSSKYIECVGEHTDFEHTFCEVNSMYPHFQRFPSESASFSVNFFGLQFIERKQRPSTKFTASDTISRTTQNGKLVSNKVGYEFVSESDLRKFCSAVWSKELLMYCFVYEIKLSSSESRKHIHLALWREQRSPRDLIFITSAEWKYGKLKLIQVRPTREPVLTEPDKLTIDVKEFEQNVKRSEAQDAKKSLKSIFAPPFGRSSTQVRIKFENLSDRLSFREAIVEALKPSDSEHIN